MGWYGEDANQKKSGVGLMKAGFILFIIFGTFFEMIFSGFSNTLFPVLLIVVGGYLVLTRSGLFSTKKHDSAETLPPTH